jgi:hypothetical protein
MNMHRWIRWAVAIAAATAALSTTTARAADVDVEPGWDTAEAAPLVPVAVPVPALAASIVVPPVEASLLDGATGHTSTLPYTYRSTFYDKIRGRDMQSYNGTFCNIYHAASVDNDAADPYTDIQLVMNVNNGYDRYFERVRYPNDGGWWRYCWTGHSSSAAYHFDYIQADYDWAVTIEGRVDGK